MNTMTQTNKTIKFSKYMLDKVALIVIGLVIFSAINKDVKDTTNDVNKKQSILYAVSVNAGLVNQAHATKSVARTPYQLAEDKAIAEMNKDAKSFARTLWTGLKLEESCDKWNGVLITTLDAADDKREDCRQVARFTQLVEDQNKSGVAKYGDKSWSLAANIELNKLL